jgi:toxin ParE1/3/4
VSRVLFTARAREDLLDIWLYVAKRNSEAVADRIYDSIEQSCRLLKDHPQLGRARPEIQPEARSIVIERWLALYRTTEQGVQIMRILDGGRDLSAIEWTPE